MSKMFAEMKRIVDEDISSRVSQYDVIFEAIFMCFGSCKLSAYTQVDTYSVFVNK